MGDRADVVVVGGGVGGLAVAVRLAAARRRVVVVERRREVGGKLASTDWNGYRFDLGPSLLTLPHVFDDLFAAAGTSLRHEVSLVRLDPQFGYHWTDGSALVVADDRDATADAFEAFVSGGGTAWRRWDEHGRRIWDVSERTFFAGPMTGPMQLLRRMRSPLDLVAIDPLRSLHVRASRAFGEPHLVQWAGRYATYSGSSPFEAPATLACIPHVESRFGCWYPMGGMDALRNALLGVAASVGVEVRTGADVIAVRTTDDRVTGVELADGSTIVAPVVVSGVDAEHLYTDLIVDDRSRRARQPVARSTSGFVVAAAVNGLTPELQHHNVWFSSDERVEFDALAAGKMAGDPTIYGCVSAVTDPSQAPDGCENWFLLVNTPAGIELDADVQRRYMLDVLAERGVDLRGRIEWSTTMTPTDMEERYRAPGGAIYGSSSNGRRAAFARPNNRSRHRGLYLVGGSTHPGGGLPLVAIGARIVADLIEKDGVGT